MRSSLSVLMIAAMLKSPASAGGITVELSGMSIECSVYPPKRVFRFLCGGVNRGSRGFPMSLRARNYGGRVLS